MQRSYEVSMKSAHGYRSWRIKFFLLLALAAILTIGAKLFLD